MDTFSATKFYLDTEGYNAETCEAQRPWSEGCSCGTHELQIKSILLGVLTALDLGGYNKMSALGFDSSLNAHGHS